MRNLIHSGNGDVLIEPLHALELLLVYRVKANGAAIPLRMVRSAEIVKNARIAEDLSSISLLPEIAMLELTCPHFVMRGAEGGDRQIGHVV